MAMEFISGIQVIGTEDANFIVRDSKKEDCAIYYFSTAEHSGRQGFFDSVRNTFPLDPPLIGDRSWDALSDSLWEGLFILPARKIAILWPDSSKFKEDFPADYRIAFAVLVDVVRSLCTAKTSDGTPKEVGLYLG
jgi:hypothetical protein